MNLAMCMVDFLLRTLQQSCGYYTFNPDEKVEACYYLTCPGTLLVSRCVPKSTVSTTPSVILPLSSDLVVVFPREKC